MNVPCSCYEPPPAPVLGMRAFNLVCPEINGRSCRSDCRGLWLVDAL